MDGVDERLPKEWILRTDVIKCFHTDFTESAVVGRSDSCRANGVIDKSNFAEVIILAQSPHILIEKLLLIYIIRFLLDMVVDRHIAGTLRNQVHIVSVAIALLDHFDIRLLKVHVRLLAQLLKNIGVALVNGLNRHCRLSSLLKTAIQGVQLEPLFVKTCFHVPR